MFNYTNSIENISEAVRAVFTFSFIKKQKKVMDIDSLIIQVIMLIMAN